MPRLRLLSNLSEFDAQLRLEMPTEAGALTLKSLLEALAAQIIVTKDLVRVLESNIRVSVIGGSHPGEYQSLLAFFVSRCPSGTIVHADMCRT